MTPASRENPRGSMGMGVLSNGTRCDHDRVTTAYEVRMPTISTAKNALTISQPIQPVRYLFGRL